MPGPCQDDDEDEQAHGSGYADRLEHDTAARVQPEGGEKNRAEQERARNTDRKAGKPLCRELRLIRHGHLLERPLRQLRRAEESRRGEDRAAGRARAAGPRRHGPRRSEAGEPGQHSPGGRRREPDAEYSDSRETQRKHEHLDPVGLDRRVDSDAGRGNDCGRRES